MVGRMSQRTRRVNLRMPLPPPPDVKKENVAPNKPILAGPGTKPDRICAICLGKMAPGTPLTFCVCGKLFHVDCISEIHFCPLCNHYLFPDKEMAAEQNDSPPESTELPIINETEQLYQCPSCDAYVEETCERCRCGVIFEKEEEVYLCPGCANQVAPDARNCLHCGMLFE